MTKCGNIISVNTHEAKSNLSMLLREVEDNGQCVRICRNGKPIAELRPVQLVPDPLAPHPELKALHVADDTFAPLDEEDWPKEYR
jgi:prevent-host-death family protein